MQKIRAFGYIDVDDPRDYRPTADAIVKLDVYEDAKIKTRSIGFIWPDEESKLVVVK